MSTVAGEVTSMNTTYTYTGELTTASPELSIRELVRSYPLHRAGFLIQYWYLPFIIPTGLVGNILSLIVMLQPHNRKISVCVYLAFLAVTDSIMLFLGSQYWLFSILATGTPRPGVCKIFTWIFQFVSLAGICLIIAMTTDRVVAICLPHRSRYLCTPLKATVVSIILLLVSPVYSLPHIYATGIIPGTNLCVAFLHSNDFIKAYSWINTCLNSIVPFVLLMTMNSLIIHTMRNRKVLPLAIHPLNENVSGSDVKRRKIAAERAMERQLTLMLLVVTFTLLFLTLPLYIRYMLFQLIDYTKDPRIFSVWVFLSQLTNKMYYTNSAVNFYLYCIAGSQISKRSEEVIPG